MLFKYCWCRYTWYYLAKAGTRDCCSCITRPLLGRDSARECYFIIVGVGMWGKDSGGEGGWDAFRNHDHTKPIQV